MSRARTRAATPAPALSARQAADVLAVSERRVRALVGDGRLEVVSADGQPLRVSAASVQAEVDRRDEAEREREQREAQAAESVAAIGGRRAASGRVRQRGRSGGGDGADVAADVLRRLDDLAARVEGRGEVELATSAARIESLTAQLVDASERAARESVRAELVAGQLVEARAEVERLRGELEAVRRGTAGGEQPAEQERRTWWRR